MCAISDDLPVIADLPPLRPGTQQPGDGAKRALRARLLAARRARPAGLRAALAERLTAGAGAVPALRGARTVAAYAPLPGEPDVEALLERLLVAEVRVLLPVPWSDRRLGWGLHLGGGRWLPGRYGGRLPAGPQLGPQALREADVALVPALAVGRDGARLGRGGGSYDRALAQAPGVPAVAVLYDDEVLAAVPADGHDRRVHAAWTPGGYVALPRWR